MASWVSQYLIACVPVHYARAPPRVMDWNHIIIRYRMRALSRDRVQFDRKICPYKSAILDFLQKLPFAFAQSVLGRANFALINPPFCGDNFLTDAR